MANKEIKDLNPIGTATSDDLLASQQNTGGNTWVTGKLSLSALGVFLNKALQYASDLHTTNKTIIGAINELEAGGGGGGGGTANLTELTQAEYDALEQAGELEEDMMYFITDANGDGSQFQPVIYSTSEREIGVWTDGKPLYEKTASVTIENSSAQILITVSNAEYKRIEGFISSSSGVVPVPFNDGTSLYVPYTDGNDIKLAKSNASQGVGNTLVLTVRYTKSTDTAGSGTWTPQGVPAVHYSTTEQIVGTWIDGSPVYEKTISLDNISGTSYSTSSLGLSIDKVVSFFAYVQLGSEGGNAWMTSPHMENAQYRLDCHYQSADEKIYLKSDWGLANAIIVMRYTKSSS